MGFFGSLGSAFGSFGSRLGGFASSSLSSSKNFLSGLGSRASNTYDSYNASSTYGGKFSGGTGSGDTWVPISATSNSPANIPLPDSFYTSRNR